MDIYIVRVPSGHDWLVEAESESAALAEWPEDAEEATGADVPSIAEALAAHASGESDVDDDTLRDWVLARATWTFDEHASGAQLIGFGGVLLAACFYAPDEIDLTGDGCGVLGDFAEFASVDDIDWPDEDEARTAVGM